MLSTNVALVTSLLYVALLFLIAFYSERTTNEGYRRLLRSPAVYTLSISVYCTSWTFFGAVGSAVRTGLDFAAIYLGPTLIFVGWWFFLRKLVRIGKAHRITSIADLISSRYGKDPRLAVLATLVAVVGTTPYIALQLNAITTSFGVVSRSAPLSGAPDITTAFWLAIALATFTILFGTRNVDADEHHPGVVAAIAFEALVKLIALISVGLFVVFGIGGGVVSVFSLPEAQEVLKSEEAFGSRWMVLTMLSAVAIICLPRQFQVTVVENADERGLLTASWLFPTYLLLISLFVLPIAIVGLSTMPAGSNPDMFVLTLPMSERQDLLALFVFIGGFSSATSMVIVASIALSIMVSNHIVVPITLWLKRDSVKRSSDLRTILLTSRRFSIAGILLLGFLYFASSTQSDALASIGLIAFAGVAQFMPSIVGALFWRNGTALGATWALGAGFVIWLFTLLLPTFAGESGALADMIKHGLFGYELLKPYELFGLKGFDPLSHSLFWSLIVNSALLVLVSLATTQKPLERLQSALFVDVYRNVAGQEGRLIRRSATVDDLYILAQRIMGVPDATELFRNHAREQDIEGDMPLPDAAFIAQLERRLAAIIGGASARVLVSQVAIGETISLDEVIELVDETQQVLEYSQRLEQKSTELEQTASQLRYANEQLREMDARKDEFLSQVSHEVRTPMTSIRSFAEILRNTDNVDSEQNKRFLDIIHDESIRLTGLLDEILELGRLESGQMSMTLDQIDPEQSLQRALETSLGLAEASGVTLTSRVRTGSADVLAEPDRLTQVFINLISNAIHYNTSDSPRVEIESRLVGDRYEAIVSDNGPGIPANERDLVFKKFATGWSPGRDGHSGTGLGLAISNEIVKAFGGELLLVEDSDVAGATFKVSLPLAV